MADRGCKISWKTNTSLERWYCRATGSGMDNDCKGQRKMGTLLESYCRAAGSGMDKDSKGRRKMGTLTENYFLQRKDTA